MNGDIKKAIIVVSLLTLSAVLLFSEVVDKIIAKVNDEVITQGDLDQVMTQVEAWLSQTNPGAEVKSKLKSYKKKVLNQMIDDLVVLQEAKSKDIKVSAEEVYRYIDERKKAFKTNAEFESALMMQGITMEDLEDEMRNQLLKMRLIETEVKSKIEISEDEVLSYLRKQLEKARVRHILLKTRKEAERVLELVKKGEDFAKLAETYSEDPSKEKGGDSGFFAKGQMVPEFEEAAFALKVDEVSSAVKSEYGYHIIKLVDKVTENKSDFSQQERENAKSMVFQIKFKEKLDSYVNSLKEKSLIVVLEKKKKK